MPPRKTGKRPSKADIKAKADRAEGKKSTAKPDYDPLNPPEELEALEELPGGVFIKRKPGRPTHKWNPQFPMAARVMVRRGMTTAEIAEAFGVTTRQIYRWRATYDDFDEAFAQLSQQMGDRVERSMYERAVGYSYEDTKFFMYQGAVIAEPTMVHVIPDVAAQKHYLAVHRPDKWRVKDEMEIKAGDEIFMRLWQGMGDKKNEQK